MKTAMLLAVVVAVASGCANLGNGRVDLPAGMGVDVETAAKLLEQAGQPQAAAAVRMGEVTLAQVLGKKPIDVGPFGGIPYTTERQVVLKDGTTITEAQIAQIVEILTPVVPAAIVRVVAPADYVTPPVTTTTDTSTTSTTTTTGQAAPVPALDPDIEAALEE